MSGCDEYIKYVSRMLPELATTSDLIKVGIYRTDQGAAHARRSGKCPEFFRMNKKVILYPKCSVIEFLIKSKDESCA